MPCWAWSRLTQRGVAGLVELLAGPAADGQVEGWLAGQAQAGPLAVGQGGPADVGAVAVLLGVGVGGLEPVDGGGEAADPGGAAGVGVGLAGAASEPLDQAEGG